MRKNILEQYCATILSKIFNQMNYFSKNNLKYEHFNVKIPLVTLLIIKIYNLSKAIIKLNPGLNYEVDKVKLLNFKIKNGPGRYCRFVGIKNVEYFLYAIRYELK